MTFNKLGQSLTCVSVICLWPLIELNWNAVSHRSSLPRLFIGMSTESTLQIYSSYIICLKPFEIPSSTQICRLHDVLNIPQWRESVVQQVQSTHPSEKNEEEVFAFTSQLSWPFWLRAPWDCIYMKSILFFATCIRWGWLWLHSWRSLPPCWHWRAIWSSQHMSRSYRDNEQLVSVVTLS